MIPGLNPIAIKDLKALSSPKTWILEGFLDELDSLTPIRGTIVAEHQGEALSVKGDFHTVISLICDRCLENFTQPLKVDSKELIFIGEEKELAIAIEFNDFSDCISPCNSFDPQRWVFEQLSLQLPLLNNCGNNCAGVSNQKANPQIYSNNSGENDLNQLDPRWSELKKLLKP